MVQVHPLFVSSPDSMLLNSAYIFYFINLYFLESSLRCLIFFITTDSVIITALGFTLTISSPYANGYNDLNLFTYVPGSMSLFFESFHLPQYFRYVYYSYFPSYYFHLIVLMRCNNLDWSIVVSDSCLIFAEWLIFTNLPIILFLASCLVSMSSLFPFWVLSYFLIANYG